MTPVILRITTTAAVSWLLASSIAHAQPTQGRTRAEVEAEAVAVAAAHAPNQNVTSGSRVNSKVESTMQTAKDGVRAAAKTVPAR